MTYMTRSIIYGRVPYERDKIYYACNVGMMKAIFPQKGIIKFVTYRKLDVGLCVCDIEILIIVSG